jgi:exopolysaccharide biosynthesis polyprenyl glycosylphosphotransferase
MGAHSSATEPAQAAKPAARRYEGIWRDALLRRMLALADGSAALLALVSLDVLFSRGVDTALWAAVFVPVWVLFAKLHGLYDQDQQALRHLTADELPNVLIWALTATTATSLLLTATPAGPLQVHAALRVWFVAAALALMFRSITRFAWRKLTPRDRTIIIGGGELAEATRRKLALFPDIHVRLVAEWPESAIAELEQEPDWTRDIDRVILASQAIDEGLIADLVAFCRRRRVKLSVVPPARGMFGTAVRLNHVADLPLVEYSTWDVSRSTMLLKRTMDVVIAATALVLLLPLFVLIAIVVRLDTPGSPLFVQIRAGRGGRPFRMLKFRTMACDAEEQLGELVPFESLRDPMFKLRRDPRVTRVGRFLRSTSLDELPQLLNVLRGDMSLVGPRPEQLDLVERYRPEHRFRLAVKPGMTGPMQVCGRGNLTFEERLAVEREYIENLSVGRDVRILVLTLPAVAAGRGAY